MGHDTLFKWLGLFGLCHLLFGVGQGKYKPIKERDFIAFIGLRFPLPFYIRTNTYITGDDLPLFSSLAHYNVRVEKDYGEEAVKASPRRFIHFLKI